MGLFCTATPDSSIKAETLTTGRPVESNREDGAISVLLAHIIATLSNDPVVTDEAMDFPRDWNSDHPTVSISGHLDGGRTICIHSLGMF